MAEGLICPQCCGQNRSLDFGCPMSCGYLQVTASHSDRLNGISLEGARLIERRQYGQASRMLAGALKTHPRSLQITINYAGALLLGGYPDHAWKVLCNASAWAADKSGNKLVEFFHDNMTSLFGIITEADAGRKEFWYDNRKYPFVQHPGPPPQDMRAGLPFSRQRISLCMIARNEAHCIGRALENVGDHVDEIILVDTGSTDDTVAIAESYGARVYHHPWTDDFSESRNHSLDHATGDWILVLDPDEAINYLDLVYLKELAADAHSAFSLRQRHYAREPNVFGLIENDDDFYNESAGYAGWTENIMCRFFKRDPRIRYRRPVHEVVEPSLEEAGIMPVLLDVALHHFGKADGKESRDRKSRHYIDINRRYLKTLEDRKERLWCLYQIGQSLGALGKNEEAVSHLEEAVRLMNRGRPLGSSETGTGPVQTLAHLYLKLKRPREAESLLREQIERDPENEGYWLLLTQVYTQLRDLKGMMDSVESCLSIDPDNEMALELQRRFQDTMEKLGRKKAELKQLKGFLRRGAERVRAGDHSVLSPDSPLVQEAAKLVTNSPALKSMARSSYDEFAKKVLEHLEAEKIDPLLPFAYCAQLMLNFTRRGIEALREGLPPEKIATALGEEAFMEEVLDSIDSDLDHGGREALEQVLRQNLERAERESDRDLVTFFHMLIFYAQNVKPPYGDDRIMTAIYCYSTERIPCRSDTKEYRFIEHFLTPSRPGGGRQAAEAYIDFLIAAGRHREAEKIARIQASYFPEGARRRRRRRKPPGEPEGQINLPLE
ncbi:MAG: glycosyltransferase [Gemmatimonadota bacterium]|nr:glycosyltransferase [Gemmatimonadota bacterium]